MSSIMLERSGIVKKNLHPLRPERNKIHIRPGPKKDGVKPTVTIAAGFRCEDGIVLCSDSEITYYSDLKTHETKIRVAHYFSENRSVSLALTGAGWWDYVNMAEEKILSSLRHWDQPHKLDTHDLQRIVEEVILGIYERNIAAYPSEPKPSFSLLIGGWVGRDLVLLKSVDTAVNEVGGLECIGAGELIVRYLKRFFMVSEMTVEQAYLTASYLLGVAKKCVPGCGGASQIMVFHPTEAVDTIYDNFANYLPDLLEPHFREFDGLFGALLTKFADVGELDEDFEQSLKKFCEQVRQLREKIKPIRTPRNIYLL